MTVADTSVLLSLPKLPCMCITMCLEASCAPIPVADQYVRDWRRLGSQLIGHYAPLHILCQDGCRAAKLQDSCPTRCSCDGNRVQQACAVIRVGS